MEIKTIIMDLDGSILDGEWLPNQTAELIKTRKDIRWIAATGRSYKTFSSCSAAILLPVDSIHCLEGGSKIMTLRGETTFKALLSEMELALLYDQLIIENTHYIYYAISTEGGLLWSKNPHQWKYKLPSLKVTHEIKEFRQWTKNDPPSKLALNLSRMYDFTGLNWTSNENRIDITPKGIDKGYTVKKIITSLNIKEDETLFICNDKNDLSVIQKLPGIHLLTVGDKLKGVPHYRNAANPVEAGSILKEILA